MFNPFKRKPVASPTIQPAKRDERFEAWPKTKHIDKVLGSVLVTEKIDGTNACVVFDDNGGMFVQSRNRIITPATDNQGFARWAYHYQDDLFYVLGPGRHFGEWWGQKIGRTYNMGHNVFSLFNTQRFVKTDSLGISMETRAAETQIADQISSVPQLYYGPYGTPSMDVAIEELRTGSSRAATRYGVDYTNPEGVCFYFREFDKVAKLVFANPGKHKWEVE